MKSAQQHKRRFNTRWNRNAIMVVAIVFITIAAARMFFVWVMPSGSDLVLSMLGDSFWKESLIGAALLIWYAVLKRSK